ncbi:hypothetical protein E5170_22185 [Pseudomonas atacamensis]|uniref:Uncharacterized protein n=1 Tax=Pseudomonas atacamensis TaxID=2565368 RepID=A0AAQ2D961_9PSED|nr:hypothetical protein E5170_22185 [Pseudomonas atacamensis]
MQRFYYCYEPDLQNYTNPPVGASLLAKASVQSMDSLNDTPLSRAGSLPQSISIAFKVGKSVHRVLFTIVHCQSPRLFKSVQL